MTRGDILKRLLASRSDPAEFEKFAEALIAQEEAKNNRAFAGTLRKALQAGASKPLPNSNGPAAGSLSSLPRERDKGLSLTELTKTSKGPKDVVLSAYNRALFDRVMREYRKGDLLRSHGLPVVSKLLFVGPPGCGKTLSAEVFAKQLGLPMITARFDVLVSSYLGETSSNLRRVFDFARSTPTVLFLDEFDAVARSRSDDSEHGELRRVVNSLLQLIDRHTGSGFIIAATNHEEQLDSAIWRRFDEVVFFDEPSDKEIRATIRLKLKNFPSAFDVTTVAPKLKTYSYAEIERVCQNAVKAALLSGAKMLTEAQLDEAIVIENSRRKVVDRLFHNQ